MITIEKNYEEFFKMLDTYTNFLNGFISDSMFTVYLIKDHVIELSESIRENIVENKNLQNDLRKKGVVALLKLGVCFNVADLHFKFIETLIKEESEFLNFLDVEAELVHLLEEIFNVGNKTETSNSYSKIKWSELSSSDNSFNINYNINIPYTTGSSYTTDGAFIYAHIPQFGLVKIGSGHRNTIKGKVYKTNKNFFIESTEGLLAYACGKLFFRSASTAPHPFAVVKSEDLSQIDFNEHVSENSRGENINRFFVEKEKSEIGELTYSLQGHELVEKTRSDSRSKIFSNGRYIYIISKVGELRVTDQSFKGLYPNNTLINVDVYDPIKNFQHVISFPLKDEKHVIHDKASEFVSSFLDSNIVTDGKVIHFFTKYQTSFNIFSGNFSFIDVNPLPEDRTEIFCLDLSNSTLYAFSKSSIEDENIMKISYVPIEDLNVNFENKFGSYEESLPSNNYYNLLNEIRGLSLSQSNPVANLRKEKEGQVYDFFFNNKNKKKKESMTHRSSTLTLSNVDTLNVNNKLKIISIILSLLSQGAKYHLHFNSLNKKNILSHVFSSHFLNLNAETVESLVYLQKHFMEKFVKDNNLEIESKHFILSSLFNIISANLKQIEFLRFDQFKNFKDDYGYVKEIVHDSIFIISEFNVKSGIYSGLSTDLIFAAFDIVQNYGKLFEVEYPDFNTFVNLLPQESKSLLDLKNVVVKSISSSGKKIYTLENLPKINELLDTMMTRNDKIIEEIINQYINIIKNSETSDALVEKFDTLTFNSEYEKLYENFYTPLLKLTFNSYMEISTAKDDAEKLEKTEIFNNYIEIVESLLKIFSGRITNLLNLIDTRLEEITIEKFSSVEIYSKLSEKISELLINNSYTYRFFYSTVSLLNLLIKDTKVIFRSWHYFYDLLISFDKSVQNNKEKFLALIKSNEKEGITEGDHFDYVYESSHPVKKIEVNKKYTLPKTSTLYVSFDPLSYKENDTELLLSVETSKDTLNDDFKNKNILENKIYPNAKSFSFTYKVNSNSSNYGIKVHFRNYAVYSHYLSSLQTLNTSIIINSIKTFFFFNYSKTDSNQKELHEMLQSKLFEGGISELLDLETSSEDYKTFLMSLKRSSSSNQLESKFNTESDDFTEHDSPSFEIEEFINKENISVENLIDNFQRSLRPRFPWIGIGGQNADKIVRGAFAVIVKQEGLYEKIVEVSNKITDLEESHNDDTKLSIKELGEIENFEYLLLIWTEISRLRQWYQEQVKDLAEANSDDFDKQCDDFVNSVIEKINFLFSINAPQRKSAKFSSKKTKLNFLKIFAKSQILTTARIENDIVKANAIKFKKNLMQGKLEEGKSEIENVKKFTSSVSDCIKITKISIEQLRTAMREMNTRAKFREIALSLINSIMCEIECNDTKLFIIKQIILTLRKTSGKRLVSIDEEIKSASPDLLAKIQMRFSNLIQVIFGNLLKSKTYFYISGYLECLYWNLRARNQKTLIEVNFFENLFVHNSNHLIKSVWDKIGSMQEDSFVKLNPNLYKKNKNSFKFTQKTLGYQLLEFFHIYASMIAGRIIEENCNSEDDNQSKTQQGSSLGLMKKKSSVLENSYEKLLENICHIIQNKLREYIHNYSKLNSEINNNKYTEFLNAGTAQENFSTKYFDESYLNLFLLLIYKFNINQSNLILKHMRDPDFLVSLLILLNYTSSKNKFSIVNILKVYLVNLSDEDIHNVVFFLKKHEMYKNIIESEIATDSSTDHHVDSKKDLINYLTKIIFNLRKGLYTKDITMSTEYEESVYIVDLLKTLFNNEKWRFTLEEIFMNNLHQLNPKELDNLSTTNYLTSLPSICLSILNGDMEDLHYGAHILVKFSSYSEKSIIQMYRDKFEEINTCTTGYILGFAEKEVNLNDMSNDNDVKNFLTGDLHFSRRPTDKYALIITINKEMYEKNKLKNNDVEFRMKELKDVILHPNVQAKILGDKVELVKLLLNKENEFIEFSIDKTKEESAMRFITSYIHLQLLKSINSIFRSDLDCDKSLQEKLIKDFSSSNFSVEKIKPLINNFSSDTYKCLKSHKYELFNSLKFFLDSKTDLKFDLSDKAEVEKNPIKIQFLRISRALRIYKGDVTNGKVFRILSSNCTIDSDAFTKISSFSFVKIGDKDQGKIKNYLNTAIFCQDTEQSTLDLINKIDDINFILILSKEQQAEAKGKVTYPYLVIDTNKENLEKLINEYNQNLEITNEQRTISQIEKIDSTLLDKLKVTSEDVNLARTKPSESDQQTDKKLKYTDPVEFNNAELFSELSKKINEPVKTLNKFSFDKILRSLIKGYLRYFFIHILSTEDSLITKENYEFINEQFKIVYYDACQYSSLSAFNFGNFEYINNFLDNLVNKEKEYDTKFLQTEKSNVSVKIFNTFSTLIESDFKINIQSELLEFYLENEINQILGTGSTSINETSRDKFVSLINKVMKLSLLTVNYETNTYIQYQNKLKELVKIYLEYVRSESNGDLEKFNNEIMTLRSEGLDILINYLAESLDMEKSYSVRTKQIFGFIWEIMKLINDTYKKLSSDNASSNVYSFTLDNLTKVGKLQKYLQYVNIMYYKSKDIDLRNDSLFNLDAIKEKLTVELEVSNSPYIYEKTLDFELNKSHRIHSTCNESKGKMLVITEKSNEGTYKIVDMIGDDEKTPIVASSRDHLLICDKNNITSELHMCGYNEKWRLGNENLSDYQYVYTPFKSIIDENIRIKKVVAGYTLTFVWTYDNRLYVCGEGTNCGLENPSRNFTLKNKWNEILKKGEKLIDLSHNDNSAFVFVTDKNVYVSGYNGYNIFAEIVGQSTYTNDIMKFTVPFKSSKVQEVSLGYGHCLYRLDDGQVYGIGCNSCYELNLDAQDYIKVVTKLNLGSGLKCERASAGYHNSLFLMKNKSNQTHLYSCGSNDYGQIGQGSSPPDRRFKKCLGTEDMEFKHVKAGYTCALAISNDDKLYTWGYNGYYNLAHMDTNYKYQPTLVDFFSDKQVLEADIGERNLVVKCLEAGQIKIYTAGYNGYACMGVGDGIGSYNNIPMEVSTFTGSYIQKVFITGGYSISFVKCNANSISNPFEFTCKSCCKSSNSTVYVISTKQDENGKINNVKVCEECIKYSEAEAVEETEIKKQIKSTNVSLAIRNISLGKVLDTLSLPDLTQINEISQSAIANKEAHTISCYDCNKLIGKEYAYITIPLTDNQSNIAFCSNCYLTTSYFTSPTFVYCVKHAIDYSLLPKFESQSLLKYDTSPQSKIKLQSLRTLNSAGLTKFKEENSEVIAMINKQFDEIKPEYISEYLKLSDQESSATEKKNFYEEYIKKSSILGNLPTSTIDILETITRKLDDSIKNVREFVDVKYYSIIKELYIQNLSCISRKTRLELFEKTLYDGATDVEPSNYYIKISRGKTIKFKQSNNVDYGGNYTIFGQIFKQLKAVPLTQFQCKKNNRLFKAELIGEGAIDAGGPYREMMNILCDELQSQWLDLFIPTPNNKFSAGQDREKWTINPAAKSSTHLEMYTVIGKLFGFAIRSTGFMNLNLPSFIWKQLLDQPVDISDLERTDVHTANFLEDLMNLESKGIDEEQFEYLYDQQFTTILSNGKEVELQSGGKDKKLTFSNAKEYVNLALSVRFEECKVQVEAIKNGL
jgi:alpha-tubulin suppressor-like RCC1 family protein